MGHQLKVQAALAFKGGSVLGCKTPDSSPTFSLCLRPFSVLPEFVLSGFLPVSGLPEHPCWEKQQRHRAPVLSTDIDSFGVPKQVRLFDVSMKSHRVLVCLQNAISWVMQHRNLEWEGSLVLKPYMKTGLWKLSFSNFYELEPFWSDAWLSVCRSRHPS